MALVSRVTNKYLNDPYVFIFESSSPIAISLKDVISYRYKHSSDIYIFILSGSIRDLIDEKVIYPSKLESESVSLSHLPSTKNPSSSSVTTTINSEADAYLKNKKANTLNQPNQTISDSLSHLPSTKNSSSSSVTTINSEADAYLKSKKANTLNQPNQTKSDSLLHLPSTKNPSSSSVTTINSDGDAYLKSKKANTLNQPNQTISDSLSHLPSTNNSSSLKNITQPILINELISEFSDGDAFLKNKKLKTLNQPNQIKFGSLSNFQSMNNNSSSSNVTTTQPILISEIISDCLEGDPLLKNKSSNTLNQINHQNSNQNLESDPAGTFQAKIDPHEINFSHNHDLNVVTIYIYY